jgi:subtilisin-like proprotein convertase family protein
MKTIKRYLTAFSALCWVSSPQAAFNDTFTINQDIPDNDTAGFASKVVVSGQTGAVYGLEVSLNIGGFSNGDLYAYLTHGSGFTVLVNRVGRTSLNGFGYADPGFDVRFIDSALIDIHNQSGHGTLVSGIFQPDGRNISPLTVLDSTLRTTALSSFNGVNPNGEWVLFVADVSGGDLHQLNSWGLNFVTVVPEPGTWLAGAICLGALGLRGLRPFFRAAECKASTDITSANI